MSRSGIERLSPPLPLLPAIGLRSLPLHAAMATASNDGSQAEGAGPSGPGQRHDLVPVPHSAMALGLTNEMTRRRLEGSFQLCTPCTCCGRSRGACVVAPCCYSINYNIPNRPLVGILDLLRKKWGIDLGATGRMLVFCDAFSFLRTDEKKRYGGDPKEMAKRLLKVFATGFGWLLPSSRSRAFCLSER